MAYKHPEFHIQTCEIRKSTAHACNEVYIQGKNNATVFQIHHHAFDIYVATVYNNCRCVETEILKSVSSSPLPIAWLALNMPALPYDKSSPSDLFSLWYTYSKPRKSTLTQSMKSKLNLLAQETNWFQYSVPLLYMHFSHVSTKSANLAVLRIANCALADAPWSPPKCLHFDHRLLCCMDGVLYCVRHSHM